MNLSAGISSTSRVCAALVFSIATTASAQQTQSPPFPPVTALRSPGLAMSEGVARDSNMPDPAQGLIRVDVSVTDKSGKPVVGLSEKDFTLFDNNQPQKIVTFQAFNGGIQPASSLEVVLVINELNLPETVRSGKLKLSAADREAETFLRSHGGVLQHPTRIYRLTDRGLFATPHTSVDGNLLADELEQGGPERRIWSPSEIALRGISVVAALRLPSRASTPTPALSE